MHRSQIVTLREANSLHLIAGEAPLFKHQSTKQLSIHRRCGSHGVSNHTWSSASIHKTYDHARSQGWPFDGGLWDKDAPVLFLANGTIEAALVRHHQEFSAEATIFLPMTLLLESELRNVSVLDSLEMCWMPV